MEYSNTALPVVMTGLLTLNGCSSMQPHDLSEANVPAGLQRVEYPRIEVAYIKPGVDFSYYKKIMLKVVDVEFREGWQDDHDISLIDQERIKDALQELFHDVFQDEMENKGNIPVVDAPDIDVLAIQVQLVDLDITQVDDLGAAGSTRTYVTSAGSVKMIGNLSDSISAEPLAQLEDKRAARAVTDFEISNRVTNTEEARQAVRYWAGLLREQMVILEAGS